MKRIVQVVAFITVLALAWIAWKLHPWMQSGHAVRLGSWNIAGREFQVWQRKNNDLLEAFATGFFVRTGTNQWRTYCLDIQDHYSSKIEVRADQSQIIVLRDGVKLGDFDVPSASFKRATDGAVVNAVVISNEPPADWWLK